MAAPELPKLVEEALRDIAPHDVREAMATLVRQRLPLLKKQARARNEAIVNRGTLAMVITGDETGRLALASAYAKALHGFEITEGRDDAESTVINRVQWRNVIADEQGNPLPFRKACDKLYSAKSDAEGGVLVIENIYDLPPNAANENAVTQAKNGAFQMLADLLTDYSMRDYTPVIVLTGEADKMHRFLEEHRSPAVYFTSPVLTAAAAPPPPPPVMPAETTSDVTIRRPLKLKRPGL